MTSQAKTSKIKLPMKITITSEDKTYSVETDKDVNAESLADTFRGLMVSMGYYPRIVLTQIGSFAELFNGDCKFHKEPQWSGFLQEEIEEEKE